jgi:phosphopantetheinyl transferase (holo-ACP synthase)
MAVPKKVEEMEKEALELFNSNEKDSKEEASQEEIMQKEEDSENSSLITETQSVSTNDEQQESIQEFSAVPESKKHAKEEDVNYWKHKYHVLQGKYNAEIPRLQEQNNKLLSYLEELKKEIAILKEMKTQETPVYVSSSNKIEQFKAEYPDIYEVISELWAEKEAKYKEEITKLKEELNKTSMTVTKTAQEMFYDELTRLVPDWSVINTDPKFLSWLQEIDDLTGLKRHDILLNAYNSLDAVRVAKIFNIYKNLVKSNQQSKENLVSPETRKVPVKQPPTQIGISDIEVDRLVEEIKKAISRGNLKKATEYEKQLENLFRR